MKVRSRPSIPSSRHQPGRRVLDHRQRAQVRRDAAAGIPPGLTQTKFGISSYVYRRAVDNDYEKPDVLVDGERQLGLDVRDLS
jgi:hypothetical protein